MSWSTQVIWLGQAIVAWRLVTPATSDRWLHGALAWCLWSGIVSAGVYLSHRLSSGGAEWIAPLALLIGSAALVPLARTRLVTDHATPRCRGDRLLILAVASAVLLAAAGAALHVFHHPHGWYDAWFQWHPKAALLALPTSNWTVFRAALLDQTHADYPLLLPGVVAAGLDACGQRSSVPSIVVATAFTIATVVLVGRGLRATCGWRVGAIGVLCLLASRQFLVTGLDQLADVPLACFVVAAITVLGVDPSDRYRAALAGAMLGCAAWTKNEGLLVGVAAAAGCSPLMRAFRGRAFSVLVTMLTGAAPFLVLAGVHKLSIPTANDLVDGWGTGSLDQLLDWSRWNTVGFAVARTLLEWGYGLVLSMPLLAWWWRGSAHRLDPVTRWWCLTLALTLGGFVLVYVTTPHVIEHHLQTSLHRVLVQIWPGFVVVVLRGVARAN